jgi:hypothetical protein
MESRIQTKIDVHLRAFKLSIQDRLRDQNVRVVNDDGDDLTLDFLQMVFDYEGLQLMKEDFQRRRRVKNQVPKTERCCAKRANGEQCTRRRLDSQFCGTHKKGAPHGIVSDEQGQSIQTIDKVEIWMQDFNGINYFVDKQHNVYSPEDIVANNINPSVIGRWSITTDSSGIDTYQLQLSQ